MKRIFETPEGGQYFFGYYDKSPLNYDSSKLLACKSFFIERMPDAEDTLQIGYFDWKKSNEFIKLAETKAWNWQQGCMLQWLGNDYNSKIIYNDRFDNRFVTVILDVVSLKKITLPMAYYTVASSGKFALCIDNERHYWFRGGYSYKGIINEAKNNPIDEEDGIWHLDLHSGNLKQVLTMKEMLEYKPLSNMLGAIHYLEHLMISPNDSRFCFLHRWQTEDGGIYARLYTANVDGSDMYLLNDSGRMSHFCWRNDKEILAWGGVSNSINTLRKYKNIVKYFVKPLLPLYHALIPDKSKMQAIVTGDSYLLFEDKEQHLKRVVPDILLEDGHPSFCPVDKNLFVSDTYEKEDLHRELFLFDMQSDEKVMLDRLYSMPELDDSPLRCDLHPKWSLDGRYVIADATCNRRRSMLVYEVK